VRALRAGEHPVRGEWRSDGRWRETDLDALVSGELHAGTPVYSAAPIPPQQRRGAHLERMEQHTHLALLAQEAGTTPANAGTIHNAQAPVSFSAGFMRCQLLVGRTAEGAIGLEGKILS
jgi:hypothetical protein